MENTKLIVNGIDVLSIYQKDCLFNKECQLGYISLKDANGNTHIRTQCTKCGYQTGSSVPKSLIDNSDKVKRFNKRLYNAVYKRKLEETYSMTGQHEGINKRLAQMKKALRQGSLHPPTKRGKRKPKETATQTLPNENRTTTTA